jgi:outer membrane protein assembly factor BamB
MKFSVIFLLIISFFCISIAQESNFRQFWTTEIGELPAFQVSVGLGKVFIPFPNGILQTLDLETGKAIWKVELGGDFSDSIKIDEVNGNILVLTTNFVDNKRILSVRAISSETGITQWKHSGQTTENSKNQLLLSSDSNLIVTENQIIASDNIKGTIFYQNSHNVFNPKQAYLKADSFYYFSNFNNLASLDLRSKRSSNIFQTSNKLIGAIKEKSGYLYFSDNLGFVYLFDLKKQKIAWKTRLGAEIIDIDTNENNSQIFVSSKDIYFYQINKISGKKTKKFRLESSSFGEISKIKNDKDLAVLTFDNTVLLIDTKTATISNKIVVKDPILYAAIGFSKQIIVVTSSSITAYK